MSNVNNNPDREELGSGDAIHKAVMEYNTNKEKEHGKGSDIRDNKVRSGR